MKLLLFIFTLIYYCTGKVYHIQNTSVSWFAAFQNCALKGLQLATINSKNEQKTMDEAIAKAGFGIFNEYWIAGTDLDKEGEFVWMSTGEPFSYTNWRINNPDNFIGADYGPENCVLLTWTRDLNKMQWNDASCKVLKYFVCEEQPKNCYNQNELVIECEKIS